MKYIKTFTNGSEKECEWGTEIKRYKTICEN